MNRFFLAATVCTAFVVAAQAQPQYPQTQGDQPDPPSRVARLNWISGDVAFQPATVDDWSSATLNYPLTTGDHLFVNAGGRAELHVGSSAIRLGASSNFGFLNLDDSIVQMSLNEGSLEIRLRQLDQNDAYEIDTPNGAITLLRAGDYRIDTDPSRNATMVTVRSGQAGMYQDGSSVMILPHQTAWFRDGGSPEVNAENPRDDFDAFTMARDNAEDALPRPDYVPDTMIGYQDLYAYGRWVNDPGYGWVWMPPVGADWKPYSTGRWAFVEPWGWTWVDDAPWGFAPFHYGRWASIRGGWAWIPGERTYRPVYAPALVGFIGGGGFGVSVGWFPLGPREPWIPAWGASRRYVERVNVMHVTNINVVNVTNITYVNRQNVTVVSQADFAGARPVAAAAIRVSPGQLQEMRVIGTSPQVAPARLSVAIGAPRAAPAVSARMVVARTPPPPAPVSFQARQAALAQNRGLPLTAGQVGQLRAQQPAAVVARPQVRAVGGVTSSPINNRPMDRMNSRPPSAGPAPATNMPMLQGSPSQVHPTPMQPQNSQPPMTAPASGPTMQRPATVTPAPQQPSNQQPARINSQRPAAKQTKAPLRAHEEEKK